jgi:hypothetical protein
MWSDHLRPGEEQRVIPGWPGFVATSLGRVFSFKRQGLRASTIHYDARPRELRYSVTQGYRVVKLCQGRVNRRQLKVSVLVLMSFVGPRPFPKAHSRHLNDHKKDDRLANLTWGTARENALDAYRNGRRGLTKRARFTLAQARRIREDSSRTIREIAELHAVHRGIVENIKRGESYVSAGGVLRPARRGDWIMPKGIRRRRAKKEG